MQVLNSLLSLKSNCLLSLLVLFHLLICQIFIGCLLGVRCVLNTTEMTDTIYSFMELTFCEGEGDNSQVNKWIRSIVANSDNCYEEMGYEWLKKGFTAVIWAETWTGRSRQQCKYRGGKGFQSGETSGIKALKQEWIRSFKNQKEYLWLESLTWVLSRIWHCSQRWFWQHLPTSIYLLPLRVLSKVLKNECALFGEFNPLLQSHLLHQCCAHLSILTNLWIQVISHA